MSINGIDGSQQKSVQSTITLIRNEQFLETAKALEVSFLAEMLKFSDTSSVEGSLNPESGKDSFSFLLDERRAEQISSRGGIGIADAVFASLIRNEQNGEA
jgi:peptidoglycan hydrolase FlgJ